MSLPPFHLLLTTKYKNIRFLAGVPLTCVSFFRCSSHSSSSLSRSSADIAFGRLAAASLSAADIVDVPEGPPLGRGLTPQAVPSEDAFPFLSAFDGDSPVVVVEGRGVACAVEGKELAGVGPFGGRVWLWGVVNDPPLCC